MTSNNPLDIMDDEEFDWEAAAREIDVVCEMASDAQGKGKQQTGLKKECRTPQFEEDDENPTFVHHIDAEAAKTWIYPVNVPLRDYQFDITQSALFSNTLVALPTGLGKTLIAAVVMYNYFRWFPQGKIVFAAPSRPLVMQQIEACHNIVGIPQEWTVDMTGQLSPPKRAQFWKTKRVFFVTPQVLEKDIHSGTCLVKYLVCLVIDEAHRAMGNYAYCEAVRELMAVPVQLRILALTATPGSKQQTVQAVIDNLHISRLEYRSETDHDVMSYVHNRKIELIQVVMGPEAVEINNKFMEAIRPIVARLTNIGVIQNRDYRTLSPCQLLEIRESFRQRLRQDLSHVNCEDVEGYFGVLITLYYIHKLLSSHGIRPAYEMLERKLKQGYTSYVHYILS
ncbi:DEAD-box ATP-dependent RNA helicase FANCM-like [Vigna radiata var. radiata]|uniref:DEAD-box ATP-dependent RNA helicase FANCM-like n=1 Tax=Vigna radiata var. radiata TaxID=3916 RepID=A0A1S3TKM3_VIGRR|nr:DEAD-box ATP-dependent RNA helicase FANCM-like [Vigna radiata var. radiata]